MSKTIFLSLVLSFFMSISGYAQDEVIHGVIQCFESIPLVDAEVQVKSTKQIVKTDTIGRFAVAIDSGDKLTISANGFYDKKVKLKENIKFVAINMKLKPGKKGRAYAIGYGHILDEEKFNSVAQLNTDDVDFSQFTDIYSLIVGRFTGVQVSGKDIIIRGESSLLGSNAALIIVDGMEVGSAGLSNIAPIDVKSIDILKGSSATIYGSRGAGGVVIITTKTAKDHL